MTAVGQPRWQVVAIMIATTFFVVQGCASAPVYRPLSPPLMTDQTFDVGVGVHTIVAGDQAGPGTSLWGSAEVLDNIQVFARGHGTLLLPYAGAAVGSNNQVGGSAGVRGLYPLLQTLLVGGELSIDYLEQHRTIGVGTENGATTARFISGAIGFPVSEEAFPGFALYVTPTIGAGFRFGDVDTPFAGFTEIPIGMSWRINNAMVWVVEAGFCIPYTGGYGGTSMSFRF
jgi:hypothetical protein